MAVHRAAPLAQCDDDGGRCGEATADGGEVAYLRHAEVGVEENPGTLRCALRTGLRKSAVAPRREGANREMTYTTALRRFFAYGSVSRRWMAVFFRWGCAAPLAQYDDDGGRWGEATAEGRLYNRSPRLACLPGVGC